MNRRSLLVLGGGAACGSAVLNQRRESVPVRHSPVAILKAESYASDFEQVISAGLAECGIDVRGKSVLVKPNLVEFVPGVPVHTDARVLAGCIAALKKRGAIVVVGEGPGHRRDTLEMAEAAGYREAVGHFDSHFVDLNLDDVDEVRDFCDESKFYFPRTALKVDLIVSLARMKTHHWAGATLSMKNLFGLVPGAVYGWPKNKLHFLGIDRSINALYRQFPKTIGIVDGVVGMEGNGPIQGRAKKSGVIVIGPDLTAVDTTCCRLMGIDPSRIGYLEIAHSGQRIVAAQRGERVESAAVQYELPKRMEHLREHSQPFHPVGPT